MVKVKKDLTGQTFGRLTVLEQAEDYISPDGRHHCQWLCECNCKDTDKNKIIVRGAGLHSGKTLSCGCLQKERIKESNIIKKKKYNTYNLSGDYGIGYTSKGEEFYFDLEDYDLIKNYCWHVGLNGHIVAKKESEQDTNILMHRLILKLIDVSYKEIQVYHIKGKQSANDNRKENLKIATPSQINITKRFKSNNTSGYPGVTWNEPLQRWLVRVTKDDHVYFLGNYGQLEDAIEARKLAEIKYFGEWSDTSKFIENGG